MNINDNDDDDDHHDDHKENVNPDYNHNHHVQTIHIICHFSSENISIATTIQMVQYLFCCIVLLHGESHWFIKNFLTHLIEVLIMMMMIIMIIVMRIMMVAIILMMIIIMIDDK